MGGLEAGVTVYEPLSRYFSDDVLLQILRACARDTYEVWTPHPQYRAYEVSSQGRVYSCRRHRILKPYLVNGYARVKMPDRARKVHQLVLEAFIGPRPEGFEACHYDGDKQNNRLMNLRWDTPAANRDDRRRLAWAVRSAAVEERNRLRRERLRAALGQLEGEAGMCSDLPRRLVEEYLR